MPLQVKRPIRIQVSSAPQTNSFFEASHWHKSAGIISLDLFLKDSLEQREGKLHTIGPQCPAARKPKARPRCWDDWPASPVEQNPHTYPTGHSEGGGNYIRRLRIRQKNHFQLLFKDFIFVKVHSTSFCKKSQSTQKKIIYRERGSPGRKRKGN